MEGETLLEDGRYALARIPPVSPVGCRNREHAAAAGELMRKNSDIELEQLFPNDDTGQLRLAGSSARPPHPTISQKLSDWIHILKLAYPYMIPLFWVYFGEYAIMSGPWSFIGILDVTSAEDRHKFTSRRTGW